MPHTRYRATNHIGIHPRYAASMLQRYCSYWNRDRFISSPIRWIASNDIKLLTIRISVKEKILQTRNSSTRHTGVKEFERKSIAEKSFWIGARLGPPDLNHQTDGKSKRILVQKYFLSNTPMERRLRQFEAAFPRNSFHWNNLRISIRNARS